MAYTPNTQLRYEDMTFVHTFGTYVVLPLMIFVLIGIAVIKLRYGDISVRVDRRRKRQSHRGSSGFLPKRFNGSRNASPHFRVSYILVMLDVRSTTIVLLFC